MLIRFSVTRKDTGAGVPNARIEVDKAETVGFTDSQGKAEIVTYWSGNWPYSVTAPGYDKVSGTLNNRDIPVLDFSVSLLYTAISRPLPPNSNESDLGPIGSTCELYVQGTNGNFYYQARHHDGSVITSWNKDEEEVVGKANRDSRCHEIPKPPPKTVDEVASEVTTLQKLLNGTVGKIEAIGQNIQDIWTKLETEAADRLKGLLDLEIRLKAWVQNMIFELLMNNLNAAAIEYKKQRGKT
jgi:hypothetical protein